MLVTRTSFKGVLDAIRENLDKFNLLPADSELIILLSAIEVLRQVLPVSRGTATTLERESRHIGLKVARSVASEDESAFVLLIASRLDQQRRKLVQRFDDGLVENILDLAASWCWQRARGQLSAGQLGRIVKKIADDVIRTERFTSRGKSLLSTNTNLDSAGTRISSNGQDLFNATLLDDDEEVAVDESLRPDVTCSGQLVPSRQHLQENPPEDTSPRNGQDTAERVSSSTATI
jgi:hypothetical protein